MNLSIRHLVVPLLAVTALLLAACGGSDDSLLLEAAKTKLDAELNAEVANPAHPLSSLAVLAIRNNTVVYDGYFGQRSVENALPADADTLYRIASISKTVTSIGFMKLVEQGLVDLDADVGTYLGFVLRNPAFPGAAITPRMLLSHTASMRDPQDAIGVSVGFGLATMLAQTDAPGGAPLYWTSEAGEAAGAGFFTYANVNFIVLATIAEQVSQQRFDLYIKQAVLDPLGLKGGFYPAANLAPAEATNLATLYRKSADGGGTWNASGAWFAQGPDRSGVAPTAITNIDAYVVGSNAGIFGPQGSLRLSARGLGSVMQMLMNQGSFNGVVILAPATVALMTTPQWTYNETPAAPNGDTYYELFYQWGLGLQIFTDRGGSAASGDRVGSAAGGFKGAGHLGEAYGLLSGMIFDPVAKNGMVYLIGGLGDDPNNYLGSYSAFFGWEEAILRSLYQRAILQNVN